MSVGTFIQPDYESSTGTEYKTAIDNAVAVHQRIGGAFAPHEQAIPDMTVRVDAGALFPAGAMAEVAGQSTGTITAPTTNPRYDRVVIDGVTGTVAVITGTPAASPVPPDISAGYLPIARILVTVGMTAIANTDIFDERIGGGGNSVYATGNQTIYDVKTFDEFPITPSSAPISNYQVANKKYVVDSVSSKFGGNYVLITSNTTWTCPAGVTKIKATLGGGAQGGGGPGTTEYGGGGTSGKVRTYYLTTVPGTGYAATIGAGGGGGSYNYGGSAGGATSLGALASVSGTDDTWGGAWMGAGDAPTYLALRAGRVNHLATQFGSNLCKGGLGGAPGGSGDSGYPGFIFIEY